VTINVALVASGVLGDLLVGVIERDTEFRLIARAEDVTSVPRLGGRAEMHAIVVCTPTGAVPPAMQRLSESGACCALVAITPDGKTAWIHHPRSDPRPLRDLSPDELLAAIRDAVAVEGAADDA
jgi:hypothetical protein